MGSGSEVRRFRERAGPRVPLGQLGRSLERSAVAYRRLCIELEDEDPGPRTHDLPELVRDRPLHGRPLDPGVDEGVDLRGVAVGRREDDAAQDPGHALDRGFELEEVLRHACSRCWLAGRDIGEHAQDP